jgi:hypothetical protein
MYLYIHKYLCCTGIFHLSIMQTFNASFLFMHILKKIRYTAECLQLFIIGYVRYDEENSSNAA